MPKLIQGIGINDADYFVKNPKCPIYEMWRRMLTRCYSEKFHKTRPTYIGCSVDKQWHRFSVFRNWVVLQDYKNKQLDKDILIKNNKIYSPNTCLLVSNEINNLLPTQNKRRGKYPIGVSFDSSRNKYMAHVAINGKSTGLGRFDTIDEASKKYAEAKSKNVIQTAKKQNCKKVHDALIKISELILKREYFE
jgi:hypothetical protein